MATQELQNVELMSKFMVRMATDMDRMDKSSRGVAKNFSELTDQIRGQRQSITESLLHGIKLPKTFEQISIAMTVPASKLKQSLTECTVLLTEAQDQLKKDEEKYAQFVDKRIKAAKAQKTQIEVRKEELKYVQTEINLQEKTIALQAEIHKWTTGRTLAEMAFLKLGWDALKRSGELNRSMIEANSNLAERAALAKDVWQVMAKTGNSQENMLAAAKALTHVGFDLRGSFKDILEVMVQMEEGLGVSYETSAQLARIFEINLRVPVREVADKIAGIANQTSLMAEEAARFATELAKAMRLLGPGAMQGSVASMTGHMLRFTASMKDVGGDATEVVKALTQMMKGTPEAFMMRGLAGVSIGAMRTQGGQEAALQGIGRLINQIVTAGPATEMYAVQLDTASKILGINIDEVRLWNDMLAKANAPMDENQKLLKRWQEQVANANAALGRIIQSTNALVQRAFNPLLEYGLTPLFSWFARAVSWVAEQKIVLGMALGAMVFAAGAAAVSIGALTARIAQLALASGIATLSRLPTGADQGAETVALLLKSSEKASSLLNKIILVLKPIGNFLSGMLGLLGRLTGGLLTGAGLGAAGLGWSIGWSFGKYLNNNVDNYISRWSKSLAETIYKSKQVEAGMQTSDKMSWEKFVSDIKGIAYEGGSLSDIYSYIKKHEESVYGWDKSLAGKISLYELALKAIPEVREKLAQFSVATRQEEVKAKDTELVELTKALYQLLMSDSKKMCSKADEELNREMKKEIEFRLDEYLPYGANRVYGRHYDRQFKSPLMAH